MANKFLNQALKNVVRFGDDLMGVSARRARTQASVLAEAAAKGRTAKGALGRAEALERRSVRTRVGTAGVVGAGAAGGFLGLHKYHQHRDNAILAKIDQMYVGPNSN